MEALLMDSVKADDHSRAAYFILKAKSLSVDEATTFLLRCLDSVRNPDTLRCPPSLLPGESIRANQESEESGPNGKAVDLRKELEKSPLDEKIRKRLRDSERRESESPGGEAGRGRGRGGAGESDKGRIQPGMTPRLHPSKGQASGEPWISDSALEDIEGIFQSDPLDQEKVLMVMLIANDQHLAGYVIGQKGAHVKEIEVAAHVKVRFSPGSEDRPSENQRCIAITGTLRGVTQAQHLITHRLVDKLSDPPIRLMVPDRAVHMLIGKKGANVNKMTRDAVTSSIKFEQYLPEGATGREVTITAADPVAATHAQYLVARHLASTGFNFPLDFTPGVGPRIWDHPDEDMRGGGDRDRHEDRHDRRERGGVGGAALLLHLKFAPPVSAARGWWRRDGYGGFMGAGGQHDMRGGPPDVRGGPHGGGRDISMDMMSATGLGGPALPVLGGLGGLGMGGGQDFTSLLRQAEASGIDLAALAAGGGVPSGLGVGGAQGVSALVQHMQLQQQQQQFAAALSAGALPPNPDLAILNHLAAGGGLPGGQSSMLPGMDHHHNRGGGGRDFQHHQHDGDGDERDSFSMRLPNDRSLFAFIIGKQGKCMKDLEHESQCTLNIQKEQEMAPGVKHRMVTIRGTKNGIKHAIACLERRVVDFTKHNNRQAY
eukprot:CAMPEP_0196598112 /NCGR_PEP_ID=MMETSP1081-20130531/94131_1 /TAXON_ID=36882 /ORGANISM="Pyramimonas amylifera, Strain CCMP720" /LENGTH=656 /DNA_ID=CAMNT_0041923757 /DNA_START=66 /DNA_END=2035 /DNA_ORIENTATION=+